MTTLRFGASEIEEWAAFSGDRNPIHFNLDAARRLGAESVVVHGMLPLLHAKAHGQEEAGSAPGWKIWRARLKRPLLEDREATLSISSAGTRFSLVDKQSGEKLFHGRFEAADADAPLSEDELDDGETTLISLEPVVMDEDAIRWRAAELRTRMPELGDHPWVTLSAIAFSEFLKQGLTRLRWTAVARVLGGVQPANLEEAVVAVQTSHAVKFNATLLAGRELPGCKFVFMPIAAYVVDGGCSGNAHVKVVRGEETLLELSIGLMLRVANPN